MAQLDHQFGAAAETVYGTSVTPSRFYEYNSEGIEESEGRTEGNPLRQGFTARSDRFTPYFEGAAGSVQFDVLTKGFGFWLKHMVGAVVTTGPAETAAYTHTATMADLFTTSFTAQMNRPFHPTGTNQPFLYKGGKITDWTLSNSVDADLVLDLSMDFQQVDTATALATASYPTLMENLTWAGAVITIGGSTYDVDEFSVSCNNSLDVGRRMLRGNTDKKEPTGGKREVTWSLKADFDTMTQRNRAHSTTAAGALAAITATWTGPTLIVGATTLKPSLGVTIPAGRCDKWKGNTENADGIKQELSGVGEFDGTNSPVTIVYKSADSVA